MLQMYWYIHGPEGGKKEENEAFRVDKHVLFSVKGAVSSARLVSSAAHDSRKSL